MIIELHDEISQLLSTITKATDKNALGINKLFELMLENKHVVFASRDVLKNIRDFRFLNSSNKELIVYILDHYVNIYSSMPVVSKKLLVVPSKDYYIKNKSLYCILLEDACNLTCAKLSTENPTDYNFYINIFNYFNKNPEYITNLENSAFGGGSAKDFLQAMDNDNNIVLAISDSDKNFEKDDYGVTAKKVIEFINSHTGTAMMDYYVLRFREKENLIPIDCYGLFSAKKNRGLFECIKKFSSNHEFMRYVDLKDGYKIKHILCNNTEWHRLYDDFVEKCKQKGVYNEHAANNEDVCINGIGNHLADDLNKVFFCNNHVKTALENKKIKTANFDVKEHIPSYIMDEYKIIYSLLFTFGCAYKNRHNSFVSKEC